MIERPIKVKNITSGKTGNVLVKFIPKLTVDKVLSITNLKNLSCITGMSIFLICKSNASLSDIETRNIAKTLIATEMKAKKY